MTQRALPDYYSILQVAPAAEPAVIEAAYRQLARLYHPDFNPAPDAPARMKAFNEAFAVLRDPDRRARYDEQRARQGRWAAQLTDLVRDGDWYTFRLGPAADALGALAALEAAIPHDARRWDPIGQRWGVHAAHAAALGRLFVNFSPPPPGAPLPPTSRHGLGLAWQEVVAIAICLVALAILVYLARTPPVVAWWNALSLQAAASLPPLDAGLFASLPLVLLAALAALVLGYIAWIIRRPSQR